MFKQLFSSKPKAVQSQVAYTLASDVQIHTQQLSQVQFATEHYVATEVNKKLIIYRADTDERYVADRATGQLKRVNLAPQQAQMQQVKQMMGEVRILARQGEEEVGGFRCRCLDFENDSAQIAVSGESCIARFPGLERTALHRERALDARIQLFSVDLAPDEAVVRSVVRILSAGMEQNQTSSLLSVSEGIENLAELDAMMAWKIAD